MHQVVLLYNKKKEKVYIPKPYVFVFINNNESLFESNSVSVVQLIDYRLMSQSITKDQLRKYYQLRINHCHNQSINDNIDIDKPQSSLLLSPLAYKSNRTYQQTPYSFMNNDINSYYIVPNLLEGTNRIKSREEIITLIEKSKTQSTQSLICPNELLLLIINDNNLNYEYIQISNIDKNPFYTKKVYLHHYIRRLINNESISLEAEIENDTNQVNKINLHEVLSHHFFYTPCPYIKDDVLLDSLNTYIDSSDHKFKLINKETYNRDDIDLFQYMKIKDIQDKDLIVTKAFVRSLLFN